MVLIESEAKTKSCCNLIESHRFCIGSECMAWTWVTTRLKIQGIPGIEPYKYKTLPQQSWTGCCGLIKKRI